MALRAACSGIEIQDHTHRDKRETSAGMEMREAILAFLAISDQNALNFLIGEPSKALYQASTRRHRQL